MTGEIIDRLVDRFLQWKLPDSVCSDTCVTDKGYAERFPGTRSGTNLLSAGEARQMIEYVLSGAHASSSAAAIDVIAERERQKTVEGWTLEHDDQHEFGDIALAAAAYAANSSRRGHQGDVFVSRNNRPAHRAGWFNLPGLLWPWDISWWKPKDPRQDLVRAGALILAEIERIDRKAKG
jgi:hypothetical protein